MSAMTNEEYAKLEAEYYRLLAEPLPRAKPKPIPVLSLPISDRVAAGVKANPDSLRVTVRGTDGITLLELPRSNANGIGIRVDLVAEVDGKGRLVCAKVTRV